MVVFRVDPADRSIRVIRAAAEGALALSIRDVTEDAPRPAINVQRTCGKRPDHIPKPHEIGH
jgi:hypothetical protein